MVAECAASALEIACVSAHTQTFNIDINLYSDFK